MSTRPSGRLISTTSAHDPPPSAPISTSLKTQATYPPSVRERARNTRPPSHPQSRDAPPSARKCDASRRNTVDTCNRKDQRICKIARRPRCCIAVPEHLLLTLAPCRPFRQSERPLSRIVYRCLRANFVEADRPTGFPDHKACEVHRRKPGRCSPRRGTSG